MATTIKSVRNQRQVEELVAVFEGYRQQWKRDDGLTETCIFQASEETTGGGLLMHTMKGTTQIDAFTPGLTYRFWGRWIVHAKYGNQFFVETFLEETPATQSAICLYLEQCKGIGHVTARTIFDNFGERSVEVLRERPEEVANAVPRLTRAQCIEASVLLKTKHRTERAKMEMMTLVHKLGVPSKAVDQALSNWGNQAATVIKRNPYKLMECTGVGFLKADNIWLEFGYSPTRLKRQAYCVWNGVHQQRNGDTWIPVAIPRTVLHRSISGADVDFERAMELCRRANVLRFRTDARGVWVAERVKADQEAKLARLIEAARIESEHARRDGKIRWPSVDEMNISEHQRAELAKALQGIVGVLAGSPGCGKTYVAAELIKSIQKKYPYSFICAAAPTGKAAVRLTESLAKCGVDLTATTIHSLLGIEAGEFGLRFKFRAGRPLPAKFVFIDEASMPDIPLITSLLEARGRGTHLLFLGDPHQLPPVGHGAPLRDLLECGESIPSGTLSEIHRNSGRGVLVCKAIREKKPWEVSKKLDLDTGENTLLIDKKTVESQIEALESMLHQFKTAKNQKYDPIWDVQVIVAVNSKGPLSRRALNNRLQGVLNPDGYTIEGCPFRVGDKVVNTKNVMVKSADPIRDNADKDGMVYCANGEQGEVIEVEAGRMIVRMESPRRTVIIYRKAQSKDQKAADEALGDEKEGDEESEGTTATGCAWDLAYAISAHKSQGSEWPIIIVMLDDSGPAKWATSRQWLYTAISRFKAFCILIGMKQTAMAMCGRDSLFKRMTFLKERIRELREETRSLETVACVTNEKITDETIVVSENVPSEETTEDDQQQSLLESIL